MSKVLADCQVSAHVLETNLPHKSTVESAEATAAAQHVITVQGVEDDQESSKPNLSHDQWFYVPRSPVCINSLCDFS